MLAQLQTFSTVTQLNILFLTLSILLPILGLTYGSARGLPISQLGGVMIAYWVPLLASLVAATTALVAGATEAGILFFITAAATIAPIAIKLVRQRSSGKFGKHSGLSNSSSTDATSKGCHPELACANPRRIADTKSGHAGSLSWYFWIGNYYQWNLSYEIRADDAGASGIASAIGTVSSWYSLNEHPRQAVALARGFVNCEPDGDHCLPVAHPASCQDRDVDFIATVEVQASECGGLSILEVICFAEVSGTQGFSSLSVGPTFGGVGVKASLQSPNAARAEIGKSESYSYRCVDV